MEKRGTLPGATKPALVLFCETSAFVVDKIKPEGRGAAKKQKGDGAWAKLGSLETQFDISPENHFGRRAGIFCIFCLYHVEYVTIFFCKCKWQKPCFFTKKNKIIFERQNRFTFKRKHSLSKKVTAAAKRILRFFLFAFRRKSI